MTLQTDKKVGIVAKHLPFRGRLHPCLLLFVGEKPKLSRLGRGKFLYCLTTQNSLWRKETRWRTMHTKVSIIFAIFTFLLYFLKSCVILLEGVSHYFLEIFKYHTKSFFLMWKMKGFSGITICLQFRRLIFVFLFFP